MSHAAQIVDAILPPARSEDKQDQSTSLGVESCCDLDCGVVGGSYEWCRLHLDESQVSGELSEV